jgi:hypothetical protein
MRRSAYGYVELKPKPKPKRLTRRSRVDEFEDIREIKEAYGPKFFSPAMQRLIDLRSYKKT